MSLGRAIIITVVCFCAASTSAQTPGKRTPQQMQASYDAHKGEFDYLLGDWEFFLISISGAGVPVAETTLDQARNEMMMTGMPRETVEAIIAVLKLQYEFARTGEGWDEYAAAREKLAARLGKPPDTIPGTPDHPHWKVIRRTYFYDPVPTLRQLQVPTLALWGELDNNILAEKNKSAWEAALKTGGNRDSTLKILPKANHAQWEAKIGSNAEMKSLQRFVPAYFTIVEDWLANRIRGFGTPRVAHD
jgi:uncharacterized protein